MNNNRTNIKLIEAGVKFILEKGYHAAGLQEILSEAGVPKGSFYYYFKSKEDFCISIVKFYTSEYAKNNLAILLDRTLTAKERLHLFFRKEREYYLGQQCKQGCLLVKLIVEMSRLSTPIRNELQHSVDIWMHAIASCLDDGIKSNEFQVFESSEITAELIQSNWIGAMTLMQVSQSVKPLDTFIDNLFTLICNSRNGE